MPTLTTKALLLGLGSIVGTAGVAMGSTSDKLAPVAAMFAPEVAEAPETEEAASDEENAKGRSDAAHARRDARAAARGTKGRSAEAHARRAARGSEAPGLSGERGAEHRSDEGREHGRSNEAHTRRDAAAAARTERLANRRAVLAGRGAPVEGPRGLTPEARSELRELSNAHREMVRSARGNRPSR